MVNLNRRLGFLGLSSHVHGFLWEKTSESNKKNVLDNLKK